jgi:hypothetical protein
VILELANPLETRKGRKALPILNLKSMKNFLKWLAKGTAILAVWFLLVWGWVPVQAQDSNPSPAPTLTFDQEKEKLELERIELENEKLKLEMEKMKLEATPKPVPAGENNGEEKAKEINDLQALMTRKAEALAKENKDKPSIIVVDFFNNEIWHKGVRYGLSELYDLAEDNHYKIDKSVEQIDPNGDPRRLYRLGNLSLLRYQSKKRGIVEVKATVKADDFQLLTPEGISLSSGIGDVRNAYQNVYFVYDGESHENHHVILEYIHRLELDFSDRLNFEFDKDGKMVEIRFGVLDEH